MWKLINGIPINEDSDKTIKFSVNIERYEILIIKKRESIFCDEYGMSSCRKVFAQRKLHRTK
jgi:hypothetical protein